MRSTFPAVLVVLLLSAPALLAGDEPAARQTVVRVSRETTYLTEPLDAEGYVDYFAALDQRFSEGVTAENNFEIVMRQVMGPSAIDDGLREVHYRRLGLPPPSEEGDYLVEYYNWKSKGGLGKRHEARLNLVSELENHPWTEAEHPRAARWLRAMNGHLDELVEGSRRPYLYLPVVPPDESKVKRIGPLKAHSHPTLLSTLMGRGSIANLRHAARGFQARVMLRIGEGDLDGAWNDVQALWRIARLAVSQPTGIDLLIGIAIDSIAHTLAETILNAPGMTREQATRFLNDLEHRPPLSTFADALDDSERLQWLDWIQAYARGGGRNGEGTIFEIFSYDLPFRERTELLELFPKERDGEIVPLPDIDWNEALRRTNEWQDRAVAVARQSNVVRQRELQEALTADLQRREDEMGNVAEYFRNCLQTDNPPRELGRGLADLQALFQVSALETMLGAERKALAKRDVMQLGFAARLYHFDQGRFPERLDELAPRYVAAVPLDRMTGEPLRYSVEVGGFRLFSLGPDGEEDDPEDPRADGLVLQIDAPTNAGD